MPKIILTELRWGVGRALFFSGFPGGSDSKASACNAGDPGLISGLGRSSGEGNGNPLQYSCLENSMEGGAWLATVHGVAKSRTRLNDFTFFLSCSFLEDLEEDLFPCLLQLPEVAWTSWLVASASMFKAHHPNLSLHQHISFLVSDLLSSYKAPCDDIGPIWIIQHKLPISKFLV